MTNYWEKVKKTLFEYSNEQKDIDKARMEWRYFGDVEDNRTEGSEFSREINIGEYPNCELCEHPNIRYSFIIRNLENENELKVGSECINKFIEVDEGGDIIKNPIEKRKAIKKSVTKMVKDKKTKEIIKNINEIRKNDETFDTNNFFKRIDTNKGFTLKQMNLLLFLFKKYKINYNLYNYKINFKKKREKAQLLELKNWQFEQLKPLIPSKFQEEYNKNG